MIPTLKQQVFRKEWPGLCDLQDFETVVNLLVFWTYVQIFERTFRCKEPVFFKVKLNHYRRIFPWMMKETHRFYVNVLPSTTSWKWVMKAENICICIPGTQMTLALIGKGLLLEGSNLKTKDKQVAGTFKPKYGEKKIPFRRPSSFIFALCRTCLLRCTMILMMPFQTLKNGALWRALILLQ